MLEAFGEIGYAVRWRIYNCRAVLPQQRNRVYIVGFLKTDPMTHPRRGGGTPSVATPCQPQPAGDPCDSSHASLHEASSPPGDDPSGTAPAAAPSPFAW